MEILNVVLSAGIYSLLGIILMIFGNYVIDWAVPCDFPTEIKKGNQAVGWINAGSFIGIGLILRSAIMSPSFDGLEESLLEGVVSTIVYYVVGIIFFVLCYCLVRLMNKKYNLNEEIEKGNTAAGLMIFGIFIGIALIISGVIM